MSKSITKNYLYNLIYLILTFAASLVTAPYISRVLGADGVGTVSYAMSLVSYFVLFASMGMELHGRREISYAQNDPVSRSRTFWEIQLLRGITTFVILLIYILFCFLAVGEEARYLYLFLSLQIVNVFTDTVWFFQGLEEFGKIVSRNLFVKLIGIICIFVFVRSKEDLLFYLIAQVGVGVVASIFMWGYLPKYLCRIPIRTLRPFRHTRVVLALFIPTIAIQIYTVLDKTLIGLITGDPYQNGYYEQALRIYTIAMTVIRSMDTVVSPRIGHHFEAGEHETVRDLICRSYRFVWMMSIPLCFGMICVAESFVPWFFGEGYDAVVPLMQVISLLLIAIGIGGVTGAQYLLPTKREKTYTTVIVSGACLNLILNLIMIPSLGAMGAAIASVVAETMISTVGLIVLRKELPMKKILLSSFKYLAAGLVMAAVLLAERRFLGATILHTLIMVASGAVVYFGALLLLRDDFVVAAARRVFCKQRK